MQIPRPRFYANKAASLQQKLRDGYRLLTMQDPVIHTCMLILSMQIKVNKYQCAILPTKLYHASYNLFSSIT